MVTEIVTFGLPPEATRESVLAAFEQTAPTWAENPDLIRKYYVFDGERRLAGGVYLWRERSDAARWHGTQFRARVRELYGAEPEFQIFETPIVVDNTGERSVTRASGL
jgi:hypothetical protein